MAVPLEFHEGHAELLGWLEELEKAYIVASGLWGINLTGDAQERIEFWKNRNIEQLRQLQTSTGVGPRAREEECNRLRQRANLIIKRGETWCDPKFSPEQEGLS